MPRAIGLVTLIAFATAAAGQTPAPWANKLFVPDNPPAILTHDFGTVPKGTVLVHKMTVTNIYDVPLQVIDIRKSCTCLDAVPPTQLLQPHESAELVLTMNADKFTGPNTQSFFVTFGPTHISTAVIQLRANSRPDVVLTPGQVNFGVVPVGTAPTQTVSVRYAGRQSGWKVTDVVPPTGPFTASVAERGGEFALTVALKPDAVGTINDTVTLRTNDPTAPLLTVNVAGVVQAAVTVSPNKLRFDSVKVGETASQRVVIRATRPFRIQPPTAGTDGVSVETFPGAGPVQVVTIKFTPTTAGEVRKELTFTTDLGPTTVLVEGSGVK